MKDQMNIQPEGNEAYKFSFTYPISFAAAASWAFGTAYDAYDKCRGLKRCEAYWYMQGALEALVGEVPWIYGDDNFIHIGDGTLITTYAYADEIVDELGECEAQEDEEQFDANVSVFFGHFEAILDELAIALIKKAVREFKAKKNWK